MIDLFWWTLKSLVGQFYASVHLCPQVFFSIWFQHTILIVVILYQRSIPCEFLASFVSDCYLSSKPLKGFGLKLVKNFLLDFSTYGNTVSIGSWALHPSVHWHRFWPSIYLTDLDGKHLLLELLWSLFLTPHQEVKPFLINCWMHLAEDATSVMNFAKIYTEPDP